ncbi:MAG: acyltransferase, partial [Phenylobacterium sp.]
TLFHLFNRLSAELRDITLFHELLNKQGRRFSLIFGPPIPPGVLDPDAGKATLELKRYVERVLPNEPDRPFA